MGEAKLRIEGSRFPGVFRSGDMFLTKNLAPGKRVYGERLFSQDGEEYREWSPEKYRP